VLTSVSVERNKVEMEVTPGGVLITEWNKLLPFSNIVEIDLVPLLVVPEETKPAKPAKK
jgi:hypothetical protein